MFQQCDSEFRRSVGVPDNDVRWRFVEEFNAKTVGLTENEERVRIEQQVSVQFTGGDPIPHCSVLKVRLLNYNREELTAIDDGTLEVSGRRGYESSRLRTNHDWRGAGSRLPRTVLVSIFWASRIGMNSSNDESYLNCFCHSGDGRKFDFSESFPIEDFERIDLIGLIEERVFRYMESAMATEFKSNVHLVTEPRDYWAFPKPA